MKSHFPCHLSLSFPLESRALGIRCVNPAQSLNLKSWTPKPYMGGCQNYSSFLGTLNIRCRIITGTQRGTIILTTTHIPKKNPHTLEDQQASTQVLPPFLSTLEEAKATTRFWGDLGDLGFRIRVQALGLL